MITSRSTWALLLALCGCAGPSTVPESAPTELVAPERFVAGDVLRYHFDWRVDTQTDAVGLLPGDMQLAAGLALAGELVLRVYPRSDAGVVLGVTLAQLDEHALTMMGQSTLPDASALLGREVIAIVGDDGELRSIYFAPDAPPLLRYLVPGLLAQADLRLPAHDVVGTRRIAAGAGVADAQYVWRSPTELARTLQAYERFDAFATTVTPEVDGQLEITLDEHGVPLRMHGDEVIAAHDDREQQFSSRTTFAFERTSLVHEPVAPAPVLAELTRHDPLALPDDAEAQRVLAQRFSKGLRMVDVELAVYAAGSGLQPPSAFIVRATGLLRGWPELAEQLEPMFEQQDAARARSLLIDMLASAGTPEAQASMRRLLDDDDVRDLPEYAGWLQRFAFVWRPRPETAQFLLDQHDRAVRLGNARARQALDYPMGTVARRMAAFDPWLAASLRDRLRADLQHARDPAHVIAALGGLGNAASADDLELVLARRHDDDAGVRAAVASALRLQPAAAASRTLVQLVAQQDAFVADVALRSLDQRHAGDDSLRLAAIALGGVYPADIAGRLTSALLRRLGDDPWVRAAVVAMRARTDDPRERQRIDDTLVAAG